MVQTGIEAEAIAGAACPLCGAALTEGAAPLSEGVCPACGKQVMVPGKLGQYRLIKLIGAGGMGAVYEGFDDGLQRKVAVKVILREKAAEDPSFIESFKREAQSAAKLNSANIVGVYAFGESAGQPYLVMELVQPDSLDRMMERGPVAAQTVLDVGRQVAQGLRAAAEHGLVHGDVKPENILINESREAKLADFGIAALAGAKAAANNEVWGTPYYIAPETLRRQKVDLRADIYSLGATLYHAIAGVPPFEGADAVEVMKGRLLGPARPITEVAPSCPEAIAKIVMRMLEADPIRRYPNYESLLADIAKVLPAKGAHAAGKKIMIKGKSITQTASLPSVPMPSVENPNASLFAEKKGLSKGALIGIIGGGVAALLLVVGGLLFVLMGGDKASTADPAEAAQAEATAAAKQALAARNALQAELAKQAAEAARLAQTAKNDATQGESIAKRLADKAKRAVLPEDEAWLSPKEPATDEAGKPIEAPNALLRDVQKNFADAAALTAVAAQADALRKKVDGLVAAAEGADEGAAGQACNEASAAVAAYLKDSAVKAAPKHLHALKSAQERWNKVVDKGRKEMEEAVKDRQAAEKRAKEAEAKAAEKERLQQQIEAEVAAIAQAEMAVTGELDNFMPEQALATFKARSARYKSAEAKAAAAISETRLKVYMRLKEWLIKQANEGKFAAQKITAADAHTVTINGKPVEWRDFAAKHQRLSVQVLTAHLVDDRGAAGLRASTRAELAVSAHVFIRRFIGQEMIGKSPSLQSSMEKLAALAESLPSSKAEFEKFATENE